MKVYAIENYKHSVTVVGESKKQVENYVRANRLIPLTMDGHLKVTIDKYATIKEIVKYDDGDSEFAIIEALYRPGSFEVEVARDL